MGTQVNPDESRVYAGVGSRGAALAVGVFSFALLLCAVLPFLPGETSPKTTAMLAVAAVVFGALLFYSIGALGLARSSYLLDATGIRRRRGRTEERVAWSAVKEVDVRQGALGAGEMVILLQDERRKSLMTIPCEFLPESGRELYATVQERLAPLFLRRAQAYVSGQDHWKMGLIRDVVRFEGRQLFAEYPARRRTAIPLDAIRRVEVVPKSRTGMMEQAHLRIDHAGGVLRLPLQVPGMHFLPYALKHLCGLGTAVEPVLAPADLAERDRLHARLRWKMSCRLFAALAVGGVVVVAVRILLDMSQWHQARTLGVSRMATIVTVPEKEFIVLRYADADGKEREARTRVLPDFAAMAKAGDSFAIKVHPAIPTAYWFEGRWQLAGKGWLVIGGFLTVLLVAGIGFAANGFSGVRLLRRRLQELAEASLPPVPARVPAGVSVAPPPVPLPVAAVENQAPPRSTPAAAPGAEATAVSAAAAAASGPCSQCGQAIGESYFLSAGQTWCPECIRRAPLLAPASGCRPLALAVLFGVLAAVGAAGLWALIVILTGYQLGLVAIVVGILVGLAVRKGSGGTGGRRYQVLAMVLTVAALAYASVPIAIDAIRDDPDMSRKFKDMWEQAKANAGKAPAPVAVPPETEAMLDAESDDETEAPVPPAPGTPAVRDQGQAPQADVEPAPTTATEPGLPSPGETQEQVQEEQQADSVAPTPQPQEPPMPLGKAIGMALLAVVVAVLAAVLGPFVLYALLLFSDPFSLLFLAIALWEAWRFNRPQERVFEGPFKTREEPIDFTQAQT